MASSGAFNSVGEVLELTLPQIEIWVEAEHRRQAGNRKVMVLDTAASIGGVFSKKGVSPYVNAIE